MKVSLIVDKNFCFYYWVQSVCGWDNQDTCGNSYEWYQSQLLDITNTQKKILGDIKSILLKSSHPRMLLSDLYVGEDRLEEVRLIRELSESLMGLFEEKVWTDNESHLLKRRDQLRDVQFSKFNHSLNSIERFLDSDFNSQKTYNIYLVHTPPNNGPAGHMISGSDYLIIHPPGSKESAEIAKTTTTIIHEYIHAIEFASSLYRSLAKKSYYNHIEPKCLPSLPGYTWSMVYAEVIVYCFANNITGGYFKPETHDEDMPNVNKYRNGFWKLVSDGKQTSNQVLSWLALCVLEDVKRYIDSGKIVDQDIADKISASILEYYLRKQ